MKIKTYIKWPVPHKKNPLKLNSNSDNDTAIPDNLLIEERKLFWRRLKKALKNSQNDPRTDRKASIARV